MIAPYQAIRCADGYITIGAANDRCSVASATCSAIRNGRHAGVPDGRQRVRNRAALAARIEAMTAPQPRAHWLTLFEANDIPCGPINDYAQVFADPQVIAREMVVRRRASDARP